MQTDRSRVMNRAEWLWLVVTLGGLLFIYLSPLRQHLTHVQVLRVDIERFGSWAPVVFMGGMALVTGLGVPRLLLFPLGGLVFGLGWGLLFCMAGALVGAYGAFVYARLAGRGVITKKWPAVLSLSGALEGRGFVTVALLRQLPTPGHLTNIFLGVSPVGHTAFLLGTLLGALPSAIPAVMIGSSATQTTTGARVAWVVSSLGMIALFWIAGAAYFKRSERFRRMREGLRNG